VSRPAYFVVTRWHGVETPAIYWDELPRHQLLNLVYVLRLDTLPNAESIMQQSVTELYAGYRRLASRGKLPPSLQLR